MNEDGIIRREHLPDDFFDAPDDTAPSIASTSKLEDVTASVIAAMLARHRGNVSAARALGISRNTIYRKMPLQVPTEH